MSLMQELFYKMSIILSDAPNSYNSLKKLYTEHINANINSFRNDYDIEVDIVSLIRNSDNFNEFKESLQDYCNVNTRNDLKKQFFILLNIIAQNSSSYRDFKSMVELYNSKLYNSSNNEVKNKRRAISMNLNGWAQNNYNPKYKSKEQWNSFYHRKAVESPNSLIMNRSLFSNNSNNENNEKISLNNYKALNNTELKSQGKINKLFFQSQ